ncbi:mycothiol synthase [Pseudonocardia endophytica]|uniref:Mycothiol acetyltransferase n=1 Tax=Pseudonocardia endophytica TaxID=401976 RepID=A0A4V2PJ40_PSEEN|nr:mycothiol synthase [Pseudonocardia endophytica]TCK27056.1 mycothiol synthase [Pseudonocardia endophytica]
MQPQVSDRLAPDVREQVSALLDDATRTDGTPPLSEQFLLNLRGTDERDGLRHVVSGGPDGVVGYAQLDDGYAEMVVHPDARGKGTGGELAAVLESLVGGDDVDGGPRIWAHGDLPAAAHLAERRGYRRDRVLWQMRRPLEGGDPLPEVHLPDGVTLRSFVAGRDDEEFLRVNNAAFDWHPEQGGWTHHELDERMGEDWFDAAGFLLATDGDGRLLGYHWTKVHPATDGEPAIGEVYVLGVDPAAHGKGLGRMLTLAGLRHLRDRGLGAVLLYVEADNGPAVRVYERLGFTVHAADVNYAR